MTPVTEAGAFKFGPFRLSAARRELLAHGVPLVLARRAFDILHVLVRRHGELVSKDELMAEVRPGTALDLQAQISALRKLLGAPGNGRRYIVTVAGRGYRFVAPVERDGVARDGAADGLALRNLRQQPTALIGREHDLAEIVARLKVQRLVTLTGEGGVGKTRLALAAGADVLADYSDGVWLVELAPLGDAQLVTAVIAGALGIRLPGRAGATEVLEAALRSKHLLLIIDNCEHALAEIARVAERLIRSCPRLSILTSSRERLAIAGESVIRVGSLPAPEGAAASTGASAGKFAAVRLFVERAGALDNGFALTGDNAAAVAAICRRLDGIALAIELAVPRLRIMSPQRLAAALDERFLLPGEGGRTGLSRPRTLHAVIDWSYGLLSRPERILLDRLAVCLGGTTLASITAVAAGAEVPRERVADLLLSLVETSLVLADPDGDETHYRLRESTRYFVAEKLAQTDAPEVRRRHAEHFAIRLGQAAAEWETTATQRWTARYGGDVDNLRAALQWAFALDGDVAVGLDLVGYGHVIWAELGLTSEHSRWVKRALAKVVKTTSPEVVARLLSWQAGDVRDLDDPADYDEAMRAALLYRKLGNGFHEGRALLRAGIARLTPDNVNEGERLVRRANVLVSPFGITKTRARCLSALACARLFAGDLPQAHSLHEQAIGIYRELGEVPHPPA